MLRSVPIGQALGPLLQQGLNGLGGRLCPDDAPAGPCIVWRALAAQAVLPALRRLGLVAVIVLLGSALFIWRLGELGQLDETPALFAAAGRAMAETGDWLTPRVNGHPRFDKPVLIYWLIGGFTVLLPPSWDPLGSWASTLPSALAMIALMLALALTVLPRSGVATALEAALAFGLSPLILLWGRASVSDPLLTACVGLGLLGLWRNYASPRSRFPWLPWVLLGLGVLTKGPVALVIALPTLLLFGWLQRDLAGLIRALRPLPGVLLALLVAAPWFALELWKEGQPFLDSFFGYHNLQRYTAVVNNHAGPWWYYAPVVVIASLPFTPLLLLGFSTELRRCWPRRSLQPEASLNRFALAWLLVVVLFFSLSATKLASYLLPGLPAMGLLVALADAPASWLARARWCCVTLAALLSAIFFAASRWVPLIQDPEIPGLAEALQASGTVRISAWLFLLAALLGAGLLLRRRSSRSGSWLLGLQLPMVAWQVLALIPISVLVDQLRAEPLREISAVVRQQVRPGEALAMVGINKPSLHYYSRQVVLYAGRPSSGLLDLAEQLPHTGTALVVIDATTAAEPHWRGVPHTQLDAEGIYLLWRVPLKGIQQRGAALSAAGVRSTWQLPNPERY